MHVDAVFLLLIDVRGVFLVQPYLADYTAVLEEDLNLKWEAFDPGLDHLLIFFGSKFCQPYLDDYLAGFCLVELLGGDLVVLIPGD